MAATFPMTLAMVATRSKTAILEKRGDGRSQPAALAAAVSPGGNLGLELLAGWRSAAGNSAEGTQQNSPAWSIREVFGGVHCCESGVVS